jgi:hypothetical protein
MEPLSMMADYDAVLIPGGGVREGGKLPPWVAARFDLALAICGNPFLMPLSAGTMYRPPPLEKRFPISEAAAGARYLVERGVGPNRILIEACSYDTIGNAYFSRVVHVIPSRFQRVLVITSEFHMPRTEVVFRWVYSLNGPGITCSVDFMSAADVGITKDDLSVRIKKERASLEAFRGLQNQITSLADLHQWLFTEHSAYAVKVRPKTSVDSTTY